MPNDPLPGERPIRGLVPIGRFTDAKKKTYQGHAQHAWRLIKLHGMPAFQIGRTWHAYPSQIESWYREKAKAGAPTNP